jgi:hypothetical protein
VFGLIEHTNLVGDQYSWLGAIVYVAQLIWQPVVAYFLVKLPTGKFLAVMVFCWSVATRVIMLSAIANSFKGCSTLRHDSYYEFWRYVCHQSLADSNPAF